MTFRPTGTIRIQTLKYGKFGSQDFLDGSGLADAFVIPQANANTEGELDWECTIEVDISKEAASGTCTGRVYNLTKEIIRSIDPLSYIRIDAGYLDGVPAEERIVFYGQLNYAMAYRDGPDIVWQFEADLLPDIIVNNYVAYETKSDFAGNIITDMLARIGVRPGFIDPVFFGEVGDTGVKLEDTVLKNYTSTEFLLTEILDIVSTVAQRTKMRFGLVPSPTDPFQIDIVDFGKKENFRVLGVDLDSAWIQSASPIAQKASGADVGTNLTGIAVEDEEGEQRVIQSAMQVNSFRITSGFDPRITASMLCQFIGEFEGQGLFIVEKVRHDIGRDFATSYEGEIINFKDGSVYIAAGGELGVN